MDKQAQSEEKLQLETVSELRKVQSFAVTKDISSDLYSILALRMCS